MKVSILVTFYNQEKYVAKCLQSIAKIRFENEYEILVGNDGSTDNTLDEVIRWKKIFGERLKIHSQSREDGVEDKVIRVSNMRKRLLEMSSGDYYCIIDGDDFFCDTEFVDEAIKIMEEKNDISIVMYNMNKYSEEKVLLGESNLSIGKVDSREYIKNHYIPAGACVYRKIDNKEYIEHLKRATYFDDNDIVIYGLKYGEIWYINRPVLNYRQHETSIWHGMSRAQQGILNVLGADNEVYLNPKYAKEIYYRYRIDILYSFFRRNNQLDYISKDMWSRYNSICLTGDILKSVVLGEKYVTDDQQHLAEQIIDQIKEMDEELYYRVKQECEKSLTNMN